MKHVMLDIETLSTSAHAVVLSIGAVFFDPHAKLTEGPHLHQVLQVDDQIQLGRTVDFSTLQFWFQQGYEAQHALFGSEIERVYTNQALLALSKYITDGRGDDELRVWAHGLLDGSVIEDMYRHAFLPNAISYREWRDVRTFCSGIERPEPVGVKHDAVSDCLTQIEWVRAAVRAGRPLT